MSLDLSVPYYALTFLRTGQAFLEKLDPFLQVTIVAIAIAIGSMGSAYALFIGLVLAVYARLWYLDSLPETATSPRGDDADVTKLSNEVLMQELKDLDPDGKYASLYASPAIFHLLHQISFMRRLAKESFERVLVAADHYVEGSNELKKTDNIKDVGVALQQSIERADALLQEYASMALHVPLSSDEELRLRFLGTQKSLRVVLRRDLMVLRQVCDRRRNQGPLSWEPLPDVDGPRPYD